MLERGSKALCRSLISSARDGCINSVHLRYVGLPQCAFRETPAGHVYRKRYCLDAEIFDETGRLLLAMISARWRGPPVVPPWILCPCVWLKVSQIRLAAAVTHPVTAPLSG